MPIDINVVIDQIEENGPESVEHYLDEVEI